MLNYTMNITACDYLHIHTIMYVYIYIRVCMYIHPYIQIYGIAYVYEMLEMYSVGLYMLKVSNENSNHQFINLFIVNYQHVF